MNGHFIGFRPQTQKLELPNKTPSNNLTVKGISLQKSVVADAHECFFLTSQPEN